MADFLLQATLSNLLVSTLLAAIAWWVQSRYQAASLANLLWVVVLIKMVTPPLFSIPLLEVGTVASNKSTAVVNTIDFSKSNEPALQAGERPLMEGTALIPRPEMVVTDRRANRVLVFWSKKLAMTWLVVSAILIVVSLHRILRFHFMLRRSIRSAPPRLAKLNRQLAAQMKLGRVPRIVLSNSNVSPFVWWIGGQVIIVIPKSAIEILSERDLRMVVAHEMAHIKRRDHWVRWLEWFTVLALWWNPIMWWSRRQLRITEEIACDALAIESTRARQHDYASSLLNMAELLTTSAIRPPAVASAMNSGGIMEQRLKMIIADKNLSVPAWLRAAVAAVAICVFPVGLVYAQDFEAVERRLGGGVEEGELSLEQASIMLEALKRSNSHRLGDNKDRSDDNDREMETRKRQYMAVAREIEAAVDAGKLSKEDAEKKLIAIRTKMFRSGQAKGEKDEDREKEARKERYMQAAREIESAVKAGSYMKAIHEIEAAVDAGKLSKEDAEKMSSKIRMKMSGSRQAKGDRDEDREMDSRKEHYMQAAREIESAVKAGSYMKAIHEIEGAVDAGELSKEDAEKMSSKIRMKMSGSRQAKGDRDEDREMDSRKEHYMQAAREIEGAVKAGKVSKEDAEKRLSEMRMMMFGGEQERSGKDGDREMEGKKRRYEEAAQRIKIAVEKGELSAEDAEKKLIAIRKELFGRN